MPDLKLLPEVGSYDRGALVREAVSREGLYGFMKRFWNTCEPREFKGNWHIEAICEHLEAVAKGDIKRLCICVPPGTSKSITVGVFWPAWLWQLDSTWRLLYGSFDQSLLANQSEKLISVITSADYKAAFPHVQLKSKVPALGEFKLTNGGYRFNTSPEGRGTGRHVDFGIVDDPMKPQDAILGRDAAFKKVDTWYDGTLPSRVHVGEVIIMQRVSARDLAGRCKREGHTMLEIPMRQVKHTMWDRDPRKEVGQLLWPEMFPEEKVKRLERKLGNEASAQLQQDPTPADGGFVHEAWTRYEWIEPLPKKGVWVQSWDFSSKGLLESHSKCSGQLWMRTKDLKEMYEYLSTLEDRQSHIVGAHLERIVRKIDHKVPLYLLVDAVGGLWDWPKSKANFVKAQARPNWSKARIKLVELKANGPALVDEMKGKFTGIKGIDPVGSKEERLRVHTTKWEEGLILYPPGRIGEEVREEHIKFPRFTSDDHVDTTTQALDRLANKNTSFRENLEAAVLNKNM